MHACKPTYRPPLEEDLPGPVVVEGEPQLDDVEADVLVEGVEDDLGDARVVPGPVDEQQPGQVAELSDGEVGRVGRLRGKNDFQCNSTYKYVQFRNYCIEMLLPHGRKVRK